MPTAMFAVPGAGTGAYQPAFCRVTGLSVVMSNQIQPPSSNGLELDLELDRRRLVAVVVKLPALHEDPGAGGLAPVHVDAARAGQLRAQHHRLSGSTSAASSWPETR